MQSLQDENLSLKTRHDGDAASLKAKDIASTNPSTSAGAASLSQEQIESLFTTHGIRFGRLTTGFETDATQPGDDGFNVSLIPLDEDRDDIKAAGTITIDAFDLADHDATIGHWEFSAAQARALWRGKGLLYEYLLPCPWQNRRPQHGELTIRATFVDALTGRSFSEQKILTIRLP